MPSKTFKVQPNLFLQINFLERFEICFQNRFEFHFKSKFSCRFNLPLSYVVFIPTKAFKKTDILYFKFLTSQKRPPNVSNVPNDYLVYVFSAQKIFKKFTGRQNFNLH